MGAAWFARSVRVGQRKTPGLEGNVPGWGHPKGTTGQGAQRDRTIEEFGPFSSSAMTSRPRRYASTILMFSIVWSVSVKSIGDGMAADLQRARNMADELLERVKKVEPLGRRGRRRFIGGSSIMMLMASGKKFDSDDVRITQKGGDDVTVTQLPTAWLAL